MEKAFRTSYSIRITGDPSDGIPSNGTAVSGIRTEAVETLERSVGEVNYVVD